MKKIKKIITGILTLFMFSSTACTKDVYYTNISPKDSVNLLGEEKTAVLIDVRTPEEYKAIRIPGSVLIPDYEIKEKIEKIVSDKNSPVIVYCRSGNRSSKVAKSLAVMGYTKVFDLGGIINWPYETEGQD